MKNEKNVEPRGTEKRVMNAEDYKSAQRREEKRAQPATWTMPVYR